MMAHFARRHGLQRQLGFTLISVLIALFLFGFGLLAILRSLGTTTGGATQNQNVGIAATMSNGFWGAVQANPAVLVDPALGSGAAVTFSAANVAAAPAALQPWLTSLTDMTIRVVGVPPSGLPGAQATIQTFPDVGNGTPCAVVTGCSVVLKISWAQVASNGAAATTRSQTFYYQFGL